MKEGVIQLASLVLLICKTVVTVICVLAGLRTSVAEESVANWWSGNYASGNWLGLRDGFEEHGVIFTGNWKGTFYGIVNGGIRQRGAFDEELHFHLKLDFEKLLGLTGFSAYGSVRWRDGENPIHYAGTSSAFNASNTQLGKPWRFMPFYLTWESAIFFRSRT